MNTPPQYTVIPQNLKDRSTRSWVWGPRQEDCKFLPNRAKEEEEEEVGRGRGQERGGGEEKTMEGGGGEGRESHTDGENTDSDVQILSLCVSHTGS